MLYTFCFVIKLFISFQMKAKYDENVPLKHYFCSKCDNSSFVTWMILFRFCAAFSVFTVDQTNIEPQSEYFSQRNRV